MIQQLAVVSKADQIKALAKLLRAASKAYYNTGKFAVLKIDGKDRVVNDALYDQLQDRLRELDPDNIALHEIGAPIIKSKVDLPFPMASQTKIKGDDAAGCTRWLSNYADMVVSDKLDGVSGGLDNMGAAPLLATRGNGLVGQDVSALLPDVLNIPKLGKKRIQVRGEFIISASGFKAWEAQFENARNMVAGLVSRAQLHKAVRDVEFIAYQLVYPKMRPSEGLVYLKQLGFKVVPHIVVSNPTPSKLSALLKTRLAKSKYAIDGLVVTSNEYEKPYAGNPEHSRAFKENQDDAYVDVVVTNVLWDVSKHGYMKPRIEIEPTRLDGVTVTYATGHNAKFVNDNKIGPGSVIRIVRSGGVIPYVDEIIKRTKAKMPDVEWQWNSSGVDAVAVETGVDVEVKRSIDFFKAIGAEYIGPGLIQQMAADGIDTYDKILALKDSKWVEYGATAVKALKSVQAAMKTASPSAFAAATGIFGRGFGSRKFQEFLDRFGVKGVKMLADMPPKSAYQYLLESDVSEITAKQFAKGLKPFMKWLDKNGVVFKAAPKIKAVGSKLANQVLYFTGFRDTELAEECVKQGGTIANSFSSKTTILVVKDATVSNTKTANAEANGIIVIGSDKLRKKVLGL